MFKYLRIYQFKFFFNAGELRRFLEKVYSSAVPHPGLTFHLEYGQGQVFSSPTPNHLNLPSIPENRNLTEYYNAVDANNMLHIFASMLFERRIIVTSKRLSRLSACVQAANSVIYPMSWQHIFIPVLPVQLMDYLSAPMPFLIGVPETIMKRARPSELGEVVVLDADNNKVDTPFDDLNSLPLDVVSNLKKSLKSPAHLLGDSVARGFLQALVHLIGGYRDALKYRQGEKITFSEEAFIKSRSSSIQPFLEQMLQLQLFRQFIEERLQLLNSGQGFSDEFEMECVVFTEKSNKTFKNQYSAMTQNVRKEGGAFVKKVKNKTNPAVKDAMKNVIDGSKLAKDRVSYGGKIARTKAKATYKDVKSRMRDNKEEIQDDSSTHSAPSSPVRSRSSSVNRYGTISSSQFPRQHTDLGFGKVLKYERFDPSSVPELSQGSPEFEDMPRLEIDLMNDLEEVMKRNKVGTGTLVPSVPAARDSSAQTQARKPSLGDLINLDSVEDDEVIFDPLATSSNVKSGPAKVEPASAGHRKLSRTSNSGLPGSNNSSGKYENFVPAGGRNQSQFQQFVTSMTDDNSSSKTRSSDDLLSEYGLTFASMSMNSTSSTPSVFQPTPPYSNLYPPQSHLKSNGYGGGGIGQPTYARPTPPSNGSAPSAPQPPPRIPPATTAKQNHSFLYSSPARPSSHFSLPDSAMPVNQRVTEVQSCKDILADLDPLSKPVLERRSKVPPTTGAPDLPPTNPPVVPPRTKKQWTTFD